MDTQNRTHHNTQQLVRFLLHLMSVHDQVYRLICACVFMHICIAHGRTTVGFLKYFCGSPHFFGSSWSADLRLALPCYAAKRNTGSTCKVVTLPWLSSHLRRATGSTCKVVTLRCVACHRPTNDACAPRRIDGVSLQAMENVLGHDKEAIRAIGRSASRAFHYKRHRCARCMSVQHLRCRSLMNAVDSPRSRSFKR